MLVVVWTFLHSSSYTSESERKILWYPQIGSRGTQKIYNVTLLCLWWRPQCNFTWNLIHHPLLFNNQPLILCHPSVNVSLQTESSVPFSPCVLSRFSRVWLCDPMDHSPPGSSVREILQSRILKWVSMPSSRDWTHVSYVTCVGSGLPPTSAAWEVPLPPHPPYTVGIWVAVPNPSLLSVPAAFWLILFFQPSQDLEALSHHTPVPTGSQVSRTMSSPPFTHLPDLSWTQNEGKFLTLWIQGLTEEV